MYSNKETISNDNFCNRLRELRKAKGFTQAELAEKAGIDEKHLCRIENGKHFPKLDTLNNLLAVLGVNIDEVGLDLKYVEIDDNSTMSKALHILNSAEDDEELTCYLEALKATQKALKIKKN